MKYPEPNQTFDAIDHARNKVLRANQFQELVIQQYKNSFEDFWGLNPGGGTRYSVEEMQAVLDAMPQVTAIDVLQDSAGFVAYVIQAYPDVLEEKYQSSAWDYTADANGITVIGLKPAWEKQEEQPE